MFCWIKWGKIQAQQSFEISQFDVETCYFSLQNCSSFRPHTELLVHLKVTPLCFSIFNEQNQTTPNQTNIYSICKCISFHHNGNRQRWLTQTERINWIIKWQPSHMKLFTGNAQFYLLFMIAIIYQLSISILFPDYYYFICYYLFVTKILGCIIEVSVGHTLVIFMKQNMYVKRFGRKASIWF